MKSSQSTAGRKRRPRPASRPGQPGGARDTNRKERSAALISAALSLFLQRGIETTTIDDITGMAGVAKGSFYRYFADKQVLVLALVEPIRTELEACLGRCGAALEEAETPEGMFAAYRELGEALVGTLLAHTDVVRLYLQESRGAPTGARAPMVALSAWLGTAATELTRKAHRHGLLRPIPPEVSALSVVGAIERLLVAVLGGEEVGNPLEVPDALITLVLDGLRAPGRNLAPRSSRAAPSPVLKP